LDIDVLPIAAEQEQRQGINSVETSSKREERIATQKGEFQQPHEQNFRGV
jgi:hypothetical protein